MKHAIPHGAFGPLTSHNRLMAPPRPIWPVLILARRVDVANACARANGIGAQSWRYLCDPFMLLGLDSPTCWIADDVWNDGQWPAMAEKLRRANAIVMFGTEYARRAFRANAIHNIFGFSRGVRLETDNLHHAPPGVSPWTAP